MAKNNDTDKFSRMIEFRKLLRKFEYAVQEREGERSSSQSMQDALRHKVNMERVIPARDELDEFVTKLINEVFVK